MKGKRWLKSSRLPKVCHPNMRLLVWGCVQGEDVVVFLVSTKLPKARAYLGPLGIGFIWVLKTATECHDIFSETQINIQNSYRHSPHRTGTNEIAGMWPVAQKQDLGCLPPAPSLIYPRAGCEPLRSWVEWDGRDRGSRGGTKEHSGALS